METEVNLTNRNLEEKNMMKLDNFVDMMTGHFNNKEAWLDIKERKYSVA